MFQSDPEHKKKSHVLKNPKGKKRDADKSGDKKKKSRRDNRSHVLSLRELRERRRARSLDKKPSKPVRKSAPRKPFIDPLKLVKRPLSPAVELPVLEIKDKNPTVSQIIAWKKKTKESIDEPVVNARSSPSVPQTNHGKKIWGFVNRPNFHTPLSNPQPAAPIPPPEISKNTKFKRNKEQKLEPQLQLPQYSKSKNSTAVYNLTHTFRSKSKTSFVNYPEPTYSGRPVASEKHGNIAKRFLRKQVWTVSKPYIKRNPRLKKLLEESNVNIDNIKINALDLDVINVDALGIKSKALKKSVIWLLK
ncbi:hypothetical protein O0L34_g7682 [Tuta absoluta]|nr:hypothetical protein O0L34_g7682 [Tuta absoluta]